MPPGSFEMSLRSSASSAAAAIFVLAAICRSEMPRRSRAWRSFPPKSSISAVTLDNLRKGCQTHVHPDGGETGRAGLRTAAARASFIPPIAITGTGRACADLPEGVESRDGMAVRLPIGGKDGAEHQVVASAGGDGGVDLRQRVHRPADQKPARRLALGAARAPTRRQPRRRRSRARAPRKPSPHAGARRRRPPRSRCRRDR